MRRIVVVSSLLLTLAACGMAAAQTPTPSPTPAQKECAVQVYRANEVDRKVKILNYPHPDFSEAQVLKHNGSVIVLRGIMCGTGKVTDIRVVHGVTDDMNDEAIETAKKVKFTPAQKDGQNVSQWLQFEYRITVSRILP
jgi:TonB family protein